MKENMGEEREIQIIESLAEVVEKKKGNYNKWLFNVNGFWHFTESFVDVYIAAPERVVTKQHYPLPLPQSNRRHRRRLVPLPSPCKSN